MGFEEGVVPEAELETPLEVLTKERGEGPEAEKLFQRSPESFEDGNGADVSDGAKTLVDANGSPRCLERL